MYFSPPPKPTHRSTVDWSLVECQLTVNQLSVDCQSTVGQQSVNNQLPMVGRLSTDRVNQTSTNSWSTIYSRISPKLFSIISRMKKIIVFMEEVMKPNILQDLGRVRHNLIVKAVYPLQWAASIWWCICSRFSLSTLKSDNCTMFGTSASFFLSEIHFEASHPNNTTASKRHFIKW